MSLSAALSNAASGLAATSRQAKGVSSNIANALTPGYGKREVTLATASLGGVRVVGVTRAVEPGLLADRRAAEAEAAGAGARSDALARISRAHGAATSADSLSGRIAAFDAALIEAASRPDQTPRLQTVLDTAKALARGLNDASNAIQSERQAADARIARDVDRLNGDLARIDRLNEEIVRRTVLGQDANGLKDQRQVLIDGVSAIVPVRELSRSHGAVALISEGGQLLLDDRPAEIGFTASNAVTWGTTLGAPLSALTVAGREIDMGPSGTRMAGGSLAADFDIRDRIGTEAQAGLDALARDLVERMDQSAIEPARPATDPGLLTDDGAKFDAVNEAGLSARIAVNPLADPASGTGALHRLRDGMAAIAPGAPGNASILDAMSRELGATRPAASAASDGVARSAGGQAELLMTTGATLQHLADQDTAFAAARAETLRAEELAGGVDTDEEMQKLLLIETAYAANARLIQAVDAMLQTLLEI